MVKSITQSLSSLWEQLMKSKSSKALPPQLEPWMYLLVPDTQLLSWFPSQRQQLVLAKRKRQWRVAAAILFLGGLTTMGAFILKDANNTIRITTADYQKKIVFTDGSTVILNSNSSLKYKSDFGQKQRYLILLKGEAYFDVQTNTMPFQVRLPDQSYLQVLGTVFNVEINEKDGAIKTFLKKGVVNWKKDKQEQKIAPGEIVKTTNSTNAKASYWEKKQLRPQQISDILYWKEQPFQFNNTPLEQITKELSAYYQTEIKIGRAIKNEPLTGTFSRQMELTTILEILTSTTNYTLIEKDHKWSIE
jgi:ferric-dicitrate binding protein FerR (iron transport regulator)